MAVIYKPNEEPTIFNTLLSRYVGCGGYHEMIRSTFSVGYPYFEWNGRVYQTAIQDEKHTAVDTLVTYDTLLNQYEKK